MVNESEEQPIIPPDYTEFPARVLRPRSQVHQFNPTPSQPSANPPSRSLSPLSSAPDSDSESESNPPDIPGTQSCSNCHKQASNDGWRNSPLYPGRKRCRACYEYERKHAKLRPVALEVRRLQFSRKHLPRSAHKRSAAPKFCHNCEVPTNCDHRYWSRLEPGEGVCEPCHKYELNYNAPRPRWLMERAEEMRVRKGIFGVTKTKSKTDAASTTSSTQNAACKPAVSCVA
ncbi:hypothetical protein R3P38DRAFT_3121063 [Favolaschia claudopus]|uniref:GATA-type domain-containing protein n=1 Tax=Favolaschia claudopus TaxID=2862362 RepID=A0AAV9ZC58_9AGAR